MQKNCSIEGASAIYLASSSPRRAEILSQIGVHFSVLKIAVVEKPLVDEHVERYITRLALDKARAGWLQLEAMDLPLRPILAADTVGFCANTLLEKPKDYDDFQATMRLLSGQTHTVSTAVAMKLADKEVVTSVSTDITFKPVSDAEILHYWQTGEPQDKACGYGIQGLGAVFVSSIAGSYSGVVGLPIEATIELLALFQVPWWQSSSDITVD